MHATVVVIIIIIMLTIITQIDSFMGEVCQVPMISFNLQPAGSSMLVIVAVASPRYLCLVRFIMLSSALLLISQLF